MQIELFNGDVEESVRLGPQAFVLRRFASQVDNELLDDVQRIWHSAPARHMTVPGGHRMSVGMTNCGHLGWVSDASGYRYDAIDPSTGLRWPQMPKSFHDLAVRAAAAAGFDNFEPDACLVNQYLPGARLSLHQDKNERDLGAPIVSVSLGMGATFLFGGPRRRDPVSRLRLEHGDVAVWGGVSRLNYHGVATLAGSAHELLGGQRINLTFRSAG